MSGVVPHLVRLAAPPVSFVGHIKCHRHNPSCM